MRVITNIIEENGEIYEQVDSYNNETGEVSMDVPAHGDREPLQILLDPKGVSSISLDYNAICLKIGHPGDEHVVQVPNKNYSRRSIS